MPGRAVPGLEATVDAVLSDVDGTLLDTNWLHVLAWSRACRDHDEDVPMWELHRRIGMGADQLIGELFGGERPELEEAWKDHYRELLPEARPLPGARALLEHLRGLDLPVALATSGAAEFVERVEQLLDLGSLGVEIVSSGEVEASKPEPDLFTLAAERLAVPADRCVVIGDTVWDVEAARRAGMPALALETGGIAPAVLSDAGAARTFRDPEELLARWRAT